jgi:hypothetical protein
MAGASPLSRPAIMILNWLTAALSIAITRLVAAIDRRFIGNDPGGRRLRAG